tara:strand:- start:658 stop:1362 length:705 start_codon:yes stop_codon:yes gene_type:complete
LYKHIRDIIDKKKHNEAIFLGCGPSISDLTSDDWDLIKQMDIWTSNNWFVNDIVPNFYHLEVKMHRNGSFAKRMIEARKEEYKDVNWILDATRPYLFNMVRKSWFDNIYVYKKTFRGDDGLYTPVLDQVYVSCTASLTIVLDIMQKMDYDRIYFCGVDLYSSEYFWTNNEKYEKYNIPYLISTCKPDERSPSTPHTTLKTAKFIKEFGEHNNIEFVNLSDRSELVNHIKTRKLV